MTELLLILICALPFLTFLLINFFSDKHEKIIARIAFISNVFQGVLIGTLILQWLKLGRVPVNFKEWVVYSSLNYEFFIDFYFDEITAVFLFLGNFISLIILKFSSHYMHKEKGYQRFFLILMLFYSGYVFTAMAGSFENLFAGWEILGISSFLLVAFYRDRYLPVKHAVRVFSIYRIGDVGILLAIWASHHLWNENITFAKLINAELVHHQLSEHSLTGVWVSLGLVLAAWVKSAQLPFSSWLPRAMEGPTPSSAVFYGSLSVHFGVFLLIRSYPIWEFQHSIRWLIAIMGIFTAISAFLISRVQPTVKTQIAYASIAQIGLIFFEISLGMIHLALLHLIGNAFLRTYQLLTSPSLVAYRIKEQIFNPLEANKKYRLTLWKKIQLYYYPKALMEFHLDEHVGNWIFRPLKNGGKKLHFLNSPSKIHLIIFYWLFSFVLLLAKIPSLEFVNKHFLPHLLALVSFLMALKAFSERKNAAWAISLIILSHLFMVTAISFNDTVPLNQSLYFLSGILIGGIIALVIIYQINTKFLNTTNLHDYQGLSTIESQKSLWFFIGILCMSGFPITPSVIGEDILFSHIREDQGLLALFYAISYILSGITLIRMYARIFMGTNQQEYLPKSKLTT